MDSAKRFIFHAPKVDFTRSTAVFPYSVEDLNGTTLKFQEILTFPATEAQWKAVPADLLKHLLESVSLALGVSYWKMHCAPEIALEDFSLTRKQADFWNLLYTKGLGEFFYRNQIDFHGLVKFPYAANTQSTPTNLERTNRSLVAQGGGKDSIVAIELLKDAGKIFDLISLGISSVQRDTAAQIGMPLITIGRTLDPEMIRLSQAEEVYNGHIPISAIYMFTELLACALLDYRYLIYSNERSSSIGNVEYLGVEINHQWSKSLEFELLIRDYTRRFITPDIETFSLLRPLGELEIVRRFAQYPQYFSSFSSCNKNFAQRKPLPERKGHAYWCGACPKCAFVFACLAAFLPKETVVDIFGKDLFADADLIPLYKELLGIEKFKPFECVGEPDEVIVAMNRAQGGGAYRGEPVMQMFEMELSRFGDGATREKRVFSVDDPVTLPEEFRTLYATV